MVVICQYDQEKVVVYTKVKTLTVMNFTNLTNHLI